ncbi:hypothetical protein LEN26_016615 [Aphanomyces euteiches]|nr:hypothetical protein LEN26_016615 [Aphanomyces euteiches]
MASIYSELPVEVFLKIAFLIQGPSDLKAFLAALCPHVDMGPLKQLYVMCLAFPHSDFWPSLKLSPLIMEILSGSPHEIICQYYSNFILVDSFDVERIKHYVHPTARLEWNIWDRSVVTTMKDLTDLNITRINVHVDEYAQISWMDLLQRLPNLNALRVEGNDVELRDVFRFTIKSRQIKELKIYSKDCVMAPHDVRCLILWFYRQPVQVFEFMWPDFSNVDWNLIEQYYQAMFNCPTLHTLRLAHFDSNHMDFTQMSPSIKVFQLVIPHINSYFLKSLSDKLVSSRVTHLELVRYKDGDTEGIESLLRALPKTSIKCLKLKGLHIVDDACWCNLAQLFEMCTLEALVIEVVEFPSGFAQSLAVAVQRNHTICELDFGRSDIAMHDLWALILSMTHPSRKVTTKRVKLSRPRRQAMNPLTLKLLKEVATNSGGEFIDQNL